MSEKPFYNPETGYLEDESQFPPAPDVARETAEQVFNFCAEPDNSPEQCIAKIESYAAALIRTALEEQTRELREALTVAKEALKKIGFTEQHLPSTSTARHALIVVEAALAGKE